MQQCKDAALHGLLWNYTTEFDKNMLALDFDLRWKAAQILESLIVRGRQFYNFPITGLTSEYKVGRRLLERHIDRISDPYWAARKTLHESNRELHIEFLRVMAEWLEIKNSIVEMLTNDLELRWLI